jgi:LuxR family maltose regulon positive regulatory protein
MPALVVDSSQLLKTVARVRLDQQPSVLQHRAIAINNKGVGLLWTEQPDRADRHLWAAATAARAARVELPEINALGHLALLEVIWGSVREGARLAGSARDLAERRGWWSALQSVPAHLAQALLEVERNDLTAAQSALQHALVAHRGDPEAAQWKLWLGARARLVLAQGDPSTAEALLEEARRPTSPVVRTPALDRWLLLVESEVDLASARPERVEQRYGRRAREQQLSYAEQVCLARSAFEQHEVRRAEDLLARPHSRLSQAVARVEALILTALIGDITGHSGRAADALAAAVALADQEGIHRPFVSMGGGRLDALLAGQKLVTTEDGARVADVLNEIRTQAGRPRSFPVADFNDREMEVLRYLPTLLTAREIAGHLNVSVNSIKAYMRAIYRKLDVTRRREAVDRARERGLI